MLPLIRIFKSYPNNTYFVEPEGRTYETWADFLDKNLLPKCEICYPSMGWYQPDENGYCLLEFNKSADCDTSRKLAKKGDKAATIVGAGGVVLGVIGLFTPLAPVAAHALAASVVTTGIYGTARAGYKLRDRSKHGQSVNPFASRDSFQNWVAIIGSTVAIQTHGLPFLQINRGKKIKKSVLMNMSSSSLSDKTNDNAFIMGYVMNIIDKYQHEKIIPEIEYLQFCAFVLFFTDTIISMEKAENIVKNVSF
uniref:DUF4781 domain-containing protein n=1 Tax=Panagrolaimus davidi TaxID=227884 RepID=A0A914Q9Y0_9BILA